MQQTQVKSKATSIIEGRINGGQSGVATAEEVEATPAPAPKRQFITREILIRAQAGETMRVFHIKRDKVLLTDSMCTAEGCSFDVATANGYPEGWDTVPERFRDGLLDALAEHRIQAHTVSQAWIIDEDQIPKSWLGERR